MPATVAVAIVLSFLGCGGSDDSPTGSSGSGVVVSGTVANRIDGAPIDGSVIEWVGPITKTASVRSGRFGIEVPVGTYHVTIKGPSHVDHETLQVPVAGPSAALRFSVLGWGTSMFGVSFSSDFEEFYHYYAWPSPVHDLTPGKWLAMPSRVYVERESVTSPDDSTPRARLQDQAFDRFLLALRRTLDENLSDMTCGRLAQVPVEVGPALGWWQNAWRPGQVKIGFVDDPGRPCGGAVTDNLEVMTSGQLDFNTHCYGGTFDYPNFVLAHELNHIWGAWDVYAQTYAYANRSLMGGGATLTRLTDWDKFAACLKYSPDFHADSRWPDINPTYAGPH